MTFARIYRPSKTATQSGEARTRRWLLEFERQAPRESDQLMGWTSSGDMRQQLNLSFETKEEAVAYAQNQGIAYLVIEDAPQVPRPHVSYSDNFSPSRHAPWTH